MQNGNVVGIALPVDEVVEDEDDEDELDDDVLDDVPDEELDDEVEPLEADDDVADELSAVDVERPDEAVAPPCPPVPDVVATSGVQPAAITIIATHARRIGHIVRSPRTLARARSSWLDAPVDPKRFPSAAAYVDSLDRGLDAHPHCEVKGSVVRQLVTTPRARDVEPHLPSVLRAYFADIPLVSTWIPEVHFHAILHAVFDTSFAGSEQRLLSWVRDENRALMQSALYKVIFLVMSPERLFRSIGPRWGALRRGTTAELLDATAQGGRIRVRYPLRLYSDLVAQVRAASMAVIAEASGARNVRVVAENVTGTSIEFAASWS